MFRIYIGTLKQLDVVTVAKIGIRALEDTSVFLRIQDSESYLFSSGCAKDAPNSITRAYPVKDLSTVVSFRRLLLPRRQTKVSRFPDYSLLYVVNN